MGSGGVPRQYADNHREPIGHNTFFATVRTRNKACGAAVGQNERERNRKLLCFGADKRSCAVKSFISQTPHIGPSIYHGARERDPDAAPDNGAICRRGAWISQQPMGIDYLAGGGITLTSRGPLQRHATPEVMAV